MAPVAKGGFSFSLVVTLPTGTMAAVEVPLPASVLNHSPKNATMRRAREAREARGEGRGRTEDGEGGEEGGEDAGERRGREGRGGRRGVVPKLYTLDNTNQAMVGVNGAKASVVDVVDGYVSVGNLTGGGVHRILVTQVKVGG